MQEWTMRYPSLDAWRQELADELLSFGPLVEALTPADLPVEIIVGTKERVGTILSLDYEEGHIRPFRVHMWDWGLVPLMLQRARQGTYVLMINRHGKRLRRPPKP